MKPVKGFRFRDRPAEDTGGEVLRGFQLHHLPSAGRDAPTNEARPADHRRGAARARRNWRVVEGGGASEMDRDREFARELIELVQDVNEAFDRAQKMGLQVEPRIATTVRNVSADGVAGHRLAVSLSRKLC